MSDCCQPSGYRQFFNQKEARRSLRGYQKKGLDNMARSMVDYISARGMQGRTVLEAGGGIGAIQIELLRAGAEKTTNVELSGGYEKVAAELLEQEGLSDRVDRHVGDFTDLAPDLRADDVVLNRVICCYPFMDRLMNAAVSSSGRFVAATFPRDHIFGKVGVSMSNAFCRVRGVDFRSFIHPPEQIERAATTAGFQVVFRDRDLTWNAVVFERVE